MLFLRESGAYPQLPTDPKNFLSVPNSYRDLIWSSWVALRRKIKIWMRGKKVQFISESCAFKPETPFSVINWIFFPHIQILIFLREATQDNYIRSLYEFGTDKKKFGCVGSCGYAPASVNIKYVIKETTTRLLDRHLRSFK